MRPRPQTTIRVESAMCAYVSGWKTREMLTELRNGRPPLWSPRCRAWTTTAVTAIDLAALAERRGFDVILTNLIAVPDAPTIAVPDVDPAAELW